MGDAGQIAWWYLPLADAVSRGSFEGHCSAIEERGGDGEKNKESERNRAYVGQVNHSQKGGRNVS